MYIIILTDREYGDGHGEECHLGQGDCGGVGEGGAGLGPAPVQRHVHHTPPPRQTLLPPHPPPPAGILPIPPLPPPESVLDILSDLRGGRPPLIAVQ